MPRPVTRTSAILARKLRSARHHAGRALSEWGESRRAAFRRRKFESWLKHLRTNPPDALIGSNFAEYGGVREHLHAIQRYSSLRTELAPPDDLLQSVPGHEVHTVFREAFMDLAASTAIRAIHSHVFPWFIDWCLVARKPGTLWVHTYHLPYFAEHATGPLKPWQEEFNRSTIQDGRHADVRVSVSRWQCEWLRDNCGIEAVYVPNGVDVAACDSGDAAHGRLHFGADPFVLYVGRNDPVKNPEEFVMLAHRMPKQRFVMIGRDLTSDVLESLWGVLTPPNLVLAGEATHSQVQHALAACSALVVTSKREGLPTVVLEAMAHGKPVIVPNEQGCVEAINHGEFGHVYSPGEVEDMESKLSRALGADSRSERSRQRVLSCYDWKVVAPALDDIYRGSAPRQQPPTGLSK